MIDEACLLAIASKKLPNTIAQEVPLIVSRRLAVVSAKAASETIYVIFPWTIAFSRVPIPS